MKGGRGCRLTDSLKVSITVNQQSLFQQIIIINRSSPSTKRKSECSFEGVNGGRELGFLQRFGVGAQNV